MGRYVPSLMGYNLFPDEKGTERLSAGNTARDSFGYNLFPDEKGTERLRSGKGTGVPWVTTYSPMKRGLKVSLILFIRNAILKLQPIPR